MSSDMQVQPLPKKLFDRARELGIETIELEFSGGSDEGYLTVNCNKKFDPAKPEEWGRAHRRDPAPDSWFDFSQEVEEWAWTIYEYSGAGDGDSYGDDIMYDLVENKVTTCDWYSSRTEGEETELELKIQSD